MKLLSKFLFLFFPFISCFQLKNGTAHNFTDQIYSNKSISLSFGAKANLSNYSKNETVNRSFSLPPKILFKSMQFSRSHNPENLVNVEPDQNLVNENNSEMLANNESYFQNVYSNYFRDYYENMQNTMERPTGIDSSILKNPYLTNNYFPQRQERIFPNPYENVTPYQQVIAPNHNSRMRRGNNINCPCRESRAPHCDCDELEMQPNSPLSLPPIVLPIIQPMISAIDNPHPCFEDTEDCICNQKLSRNYPRQQCKCPCQAGNSYNYDNRPRINERNINERRMMRNGGNLKNNNYEDRNSRDYDHMNKDRGYYHRDNSDEDYRGGYLDPYESTYDDWNRGNYYRDGEDDDYNNDSEYLERRRYRKSGKGPIDNIESDHQGRNNEPNAEDNDGVNVNNANSNNANVLAQKNTLNKIDTVYATNSSTVNYNHHIHNYIHGAEFKFKQLKEKENENVNCNETKVKIEILPDIRIINTVEKKGLSDNAKKFLSIKSRVPKEMINSIISQKNLKELEPEIQETENFTGVMNQGIENTVRELKAHRHRL